MSIASRLTPQRSALTALMMTASIALVSAQGRQQNIEPSAGAASTRVIAVEGFDVPESVRFDRGRDMYYVSNVTGNPAVEDNTGFISQMSGDGKILKLKWITGGVDGVTLHAPKGMALVGDDLWVADITVLRKFDVRTAKQTAVIDLREKGAKFLNDVSADRNGVLFVSDTGLTFDDKGSSSLGPLQRVFRVDRAGEASVLVEGSELQAPNGVFWDAANGRLLIASLRGKNVFEWTERYGLRVAATGPGGYDGIERLPDGRIAVSSQDGKGVFVLEGPRMVLLFDGVGQPADIGVDPTRSRVAVPRLDNNTVELWKLPTAR